MDATMFFKESKQPKQRNSCSEMWLINQLYIKLEFQAYNKEIGKFFFILRLGRQKNPGCLH